MTARHVETEKERFWFGYIEREWEGERSFGSEARSNKEKRLGYMKLMQKAHHFEAMKPI